MERYSLITDTTSTVAKTQTQGKKKSTSPEDKINAHLQHLSPEIIIKSITPSVIDGLYNVRILGGQKFLATSDGRYLIIKNHIIDIQSGNPIDLTISEQQKDVLEDMRDIYLKDAIIYPSAGKQKGYIYVFTDIDCPSCLKLYRDIPDLNNNGIEVRFLAFPRTGLNTLGHRKLRNIWCAKDRHLALAKMERGEKISEANCLPDPIEKQYKIGQDIGVTGTPFLILENGKTFAGYQSVHWLTELVTNNKN